MFVRMSLKTASRATPDNIHELRVGARRLGAAQDPFDLDELGGFQRRASRIHKRIGDLRDLAVAMRDIRKLVEHLEDADEIAAYLSRIATGSTGISRTISLRAFWMRSGSASFERSHALTQPARYFDSRAPKS